jgi:prepilin-type N-terminal cleavage/methylation domain-containing protein
MSLHRTRINSSMSVSLGGGLSFLQTLTQGFKRPGFDSMERGAYFARRAFTIIEILAVIAVIALLVGITLGVSTAVNRRAAESRTLRELTVLAQALEVYRTRFGDYPWIRGDGEGHRDLYAALLGMQRPDGKAIVGIPGSVTERPKSFIDLSRLAIGGGHDAPEPSMESGAVVTMDVNYRGNFLVDPWGRPYVYLYKTIGSAGSWKGFGILLYSMGFDGAAGDVDISEGIRPKDYRDFDGASDDIFSDG